mmetsp:Transcript_11238/g.22831  ORF Transcript_11238/g.22831 Transcript_11238/m.22831 type:complete len:288 (-) Transcript_11238:255-1118(-)
MNDSDLQWLPVNQAWDGGGDAPIGMLLAATGAIAVVVPCVLAWLFGPPQSQASGLLQDARQRVALVIAHPDDEAVFFWPTLLHLRALGVHLSVLCLSTGNADGLGEVRREEMQRSCASISVTGSDLVILDVEELQDGFREWPIDVVAKRVREFLQDRQASLVLTFDGVGVSGHPNHISAGLGVRRLYDELCAGGGKPGFQVLMLESIGLLRKYLGPLSLFLGTGLQDAQRHECNCYNPFACLRALAVHWSQLVWYRVLFTVFSRYAYANSFVQYECAAGVGKKAASG